MNPENPGEIWGSGDSGTRTDLCQIVKQRLIVIAVIAAPTSTHQHQPFGQPNYMDNRESCRGHGARSIDNGQQWVLEGPRGRLDRQLKRCTSKRIAPIVSRQSQF